MEESEGVQTESILLSQLEHSIQIFSINFHIDQRLKGKYPTAVARQ